MLQDELEQDELAPDAEDIAHQKEMAELLAKYGLGGQEQEPEPANADTSGAEGGEHATTGDSVEVADTRHDATEANWEDRYKNAQSRMTQATQEAAHLRQQVAAEQAERQRLEQWIRQQQAQARQPPQSTQPEEDEILKGLDTAEEEFDIKPVATAVRKLYQDSKATKAELDATQAELNAARAEAQRQAQESIKQQHEQKIFSKHPDALEVTGDPTYQTWLSKQPPVVRHIAVEADAEDFIWLLDQYKSVGKGAGQQRQQSNQAAKAAAVPNLRGAGLNQRQSEGKGKVPFSSIQHMSNSAMLQKYPDENMIDWGA